MSKIFNKASKMLVDNRHRRNWRLGAGVMAMVLAAVVSVLLVGRASALTGGDTLRNALTGDSALLWEASDAPSDGDQSAWQKVDPNVPVDANAQLRLRLSFQLGAGSLQSGNDLQVQLPDGVTLDQTNPIRGDVYSDQTVADPKGLNATRIGSYEIQDNIITFTFDDDVRTQNVGSTTNDVQVDGQQVGGYADIDLTFANLTLDADGLAQIQLNDLVKLEITQQAAASEETTDAATASDAAATDAAATTTDTAAADAAATSDSAATDATADAAATSDAAATDASTADAAATDAASADASTATTDAATDQSATDSATTSADSSDSASSSADQAAASDATTEEAADTEESSATAQSLSTDALTTSASTLSSTNALLSKVSVLRANALNATSTIDFGQYLTSGTTVQKIENGKWTAATTFNDGDLVWVNLNYELPAKTISGTNRKITYTLPNGIKPVQESSGKVVDSEGNENGTYSIGTDGTVTVIFYESFASKEAAVPGNIQFRGKVSASDAGDSGKVHFGGNASDITIVKPVEDGHDINTEKTGTMSSDGNKISNTIIVSTTKGTGNTVKIEDAINNGNCTNTKPSYDQSSLKIVKVDTSKNKTTVTDYTPTWKTDSNGVHFSVDGLPALAAGEKYIVTYDVNVNATNKNDAGKVGNSVHAKSGNHDSWGWSSKDWQDEFQKTGEFNKETGLISWRIKVNPNGKDITAGNAWTVFDVLPSDCKLYGSYTVHGQNTGVLATGGNWDDTTIHYTFPTTGLTDAQKTDTYYIDFYTTAPTSNRDVTNKGEIWENGNYDSDSTTVGVEHRTYDLTKKFTSESADSVTGKIHTNRWSVDATLPDTQLTTFEYTDTIQNAVDADGNDMGAKSHYAYAGELDEAFSKKLYLLVDNYTQYQYKGANNPTYYYRSDNSSLCGNTTDVTINVTYYDAKGNVVSASDYCTPVKSFKITVNIADGHKIYGQHLKIDEYSTYSDTTSAPEGSTWTVKNKGTIADKSSTASHDISIPKTFDKQVYTGIDSGNAKVYKSGDTTVDYDAMDGVLSYRLMLNTTESDKGTITITDTLPKGETLVDGSVKARFFYSEYSEAMTNAWNGTTFVDGSNPSYIATPNADGSTTLTITITDYKYVNNSQKVAVYYKADISKDADWNDPNASKKTYSNTATWNNHTSSQNTTVTRTSKSVAKSGVQLDKNGDPVVLENNQPKVEGSNKVRYYVEINPTGKDLNPKSKTLTLTDTMQDRDKYDPELDISSVKLYPYKVSADHHADTTNEISRDQYSVKYDQKAGTITVTVPDELACVLVYDYTIDRDAVTTGAEVKNNCSLDGSWTSSSDTKLVEVSASATAYHKIITMYKVDADNYRTPVDATFKLEYWDKSTSSWKTKDEALTTTGGKLTWDVGKSTPDLTADTLYRLIEVSTAEGYSLDTTPHYFIWMSAQNNSDTSYNNSGASSAKKPDGSTYIAKDQISIFKNVGGSMYVTNKYTSLAVKKSWAHQNGSEATPPSGSSVTMQLSRYTMYDDPDQTCAVTINEIGTPISGSTWYDQKEVGTLNIQRGSSLVIKFDDWNLNIDVYVNGEKYQTFTNTQGETSITIDADKLGGSTATVLLKTTNKGNIAAGASLQNCVYTKPAAKSTTPEVVDTVTLNDTNGWTHAWSNLDRTDSSGNTYNYVVRETESTVASKSVTYSNNDGIQTGTIVVTNTLDDSYKLPATGGSGTTGFVLGGAVVAAIAAMALLARRMRRSE